MFHYDDNDNGISIKVICTTQIHKLLVSEIDIQYHIKDAYKSRQREDF